MARTDAGAALTETHQQGQLRIRAQALQAFLVLWPLWQGDGETFQRLAMATVPLVLAYHRLSSVLAASYYEQFRVAERAGGDVAVRVASPPAVGEVVGSLFVTGQQAARENLAAGMSPQQARDKALTRTSGTVTRLSLGGGRDTITATVEADREVQGWARVTDAKPCAFCLVLASRGPAYKSEGTASFEAHDHCGCTVEPAYRGAEWPGRAKEFREQYNAAIREARKAGELKRGTANDSLNAVRRYLAQQS